MTDCKKIAELIFSDVDKSTEYYEELYPARNLPEGARVTRFAPSPTGYLHFGGLYAGFASKLTAETTSGVFMLRIEDTDKKREVEDGVTGIVTGLKAFGVTPDEGVTGFDSEEGNYGPYTQSLRREIYRTFAKKLVEEGKAYPCFCTPEDLEDIRNRQENEDIKGYYGAYAKCRDLSDDEIIEKINAGVPYTVRLRSVGDIQRKIAFDDMIKGKIEMSENVNDVVILKADGIPTYHFAHAIDDHLMHTTHVVRGDEWIASVPLHIELFRVCGFKPVKYAHIAPIMKEENGGKRKLSKRKDPEANVSFYIEKGYPEASVKEYMLTILNSNFEEWRRDNPDEDVHNFKFTTQKMSVSGALFDTDKLADVSKNYIAKLPGEVVYDNLTAWAKECDEEYYNLLTKNPEFTLNMINIGRGGEKPRKDIACWKQSKEFYSFMFPETFKMEDNFPENVSEEDRKAILTKYIESYDHDALKEDWFPALRAMGEEMGYAPKPQLYKKNPEAYKGHVGDVGAVIRVALTGRMNAPDIWEIQQVLGIDETLRRIKLALN